MGCCPTMTDPIIKASPKLRNTDILTPARSALASNTLYRRALCRSIPSEAMVRAAPRA